MVVKQERLTSPPLSLPAVALSSSGRVWDGSKAAFSVAAAASSEPDLLYSFGSGFRLSLSWASLRARLRGVEVKGRVVGDALIGRRRALGLANERRRSCIFVAVFWSWAWCSVVGRKGWVWCGEGRWW